MDNEFSQPGYRVMGSVRDGMIGGVRLRPWPGGGWFRLPIAFIALLVLAACAGRQPDQPASASFDVQTEVVGNITIRVAVPAVAEIRELYGVNLAREQIQPVWLEIRNGGAGPVWLLPSGIDPDYFSPAEAAFAYHRKDDIPGNAALDELFKSLAFQGKIPAGGSRSGFVLTNLEDGVKVVDVDVLGYPGIRSATFILEVPDFQADYARVDLAALYGSGDFLEIDDLDTLRAELEALPCCAADKGGEEGGDPLNIVMIGAREDIFSSLLRRKWHVTERLWSRSLVRTTGSFFSGSRYRYSPVSPLYLFGRKQDISLQKIRSSIHERNHMRLWMSPLRFKGQEVWVGQISRDIGVKFTLKSPTISTHKIDPDVDDARSALVEGLLYSQNLARIGGVGGVGRVSFAEPKYNLVGDPWYSDGMRAVMFMERRPRTIAQIEFIADWELPRQSALGFHPAYLESQDYLLSQSQVDQWLRPRAIVQDNDGVTVAASLTTPAENLAILGIDPLEKGMQPLWIEVRNGTDRQLGLIQSGLDPDYMSPLELAHLYRKGHSKEAQAQLEQRLQALDFRDPVPPGGTVSGFVFINAGGFKGGRVLDADVVGDRWARSFTLLLPKAGTDVVTRDFSAEALLPGVELQHIEDTAQLREALEKLPCCASLEPGDQRGEPLNLVLVGDIEAIIAGFGRRGYQGARLETRYVFGRQQDMQTLRASHWIQAQPHAVRIWLTPLVYRGQPVWLGQASNRIGGRFTTVELAGQAAKLDPDTDDARSDVSQDLAYSQAVAAHASVDGAGRQYFGQPDAGQRPLYYVTNGKRAVLFFQRRPIALDRIELYDWESAPTQ